MPSLRDPAVFAIALQREAMPALDALAQADGQYLDRSRRRFDRDDPPPYYSSTEPESDGEIEDDASLRDPTLHGEANSEILDAPLSEEELNQLFHRLCDYDEVVPSERFSKEADMENDRLDSAIRKPSFNPTSFQHLIHEDGMKRYDVVIRHYIKKRWEQLGLWDDAWGIPGRINEQETDHKTSWVWAWQREYARTDPNHPIRRAVRLRQGLRRGEASPLPPRSNLTKDSSTSEAEAFITSRPFFIFSLEVREERLRKARVPNTEYDVEQTVIDRWKQRGDWREEWDHINFKGQRVIGWKWRHETTDSDVPPYSELNDMANVDWTPSEIDAFEAIEDKIEAEHAKRQEWAEIRVPPEPIFDSDFGYSVPSMEAQASQDEPDQEQPEDPALAIQATTPRGPGRPRGSPNKHQPTSSANQATPRRSSRIASVEIPRSRRDGLRTQATQNPQGSTKRGRPKASTGGVTARQSASRRSTRTAATSNLAAAVKPQGVVKRKSSGRKPAASIVESLSDATPKRGRPRKTVATAAVVNENASIAQDTTPKRGRPRKVAPAGAPSMAANQANTPQRGRPRKAAPAGVQKMVVDQSNTPRRGRPKKTVELDVGPATKKQEAKARGTRAVGTEPTKANATPKANTASKGGSSREIFMEQRSSARQRGRTSTSGAASRNTAGGFSPAKPTGVTKRGRGRPKRQ